MYANSANTVPLTVPEIQSFKRKAAKIVAVTAYDASIAARADEAGVDLVLVGDSLGMVVQGHSSTLPVTMDAMVYHTACVARGTYIFALPGSTGAVRDGWDGILAQQLDSRYKPCNFVELMPRLMER